MNTFKDININSFITNTIQIDGINEKGNEKSIFNIVDSNNNNQSNSIKETIWRKIEIGIIQDNPGCKAAHSAEIIDNKIYIFGGWNGKKTLNEMNIFDIETEQWIEPQIEGYKPGNRNNHATCSYDNYMYLHGGHNGEIWQDDFDIFDTKEMIWNKVTCKGAVSLFLF